MPAGALSMGIVTPMRPVEPTRTEPCGRARAGPVKRAISRASSKPCRPVQAFALPLLIKMARNDEEIPSCSLSTRTGAAGTLLVVKIPATCAGSPEKRSARSFFTFLIPQWTPAA